MLRNKLLLVLLALLLTAGVSKVATLHMQSNATPQRVEESKPKNVLNKLPVTDFDAAEPLDPKARARRLTKSKKYNLPNGVKFDPSSPMERGALDNQWERGLASTLPTAQSSAVIVGEIIKSEAFLSEDKTNVYSEFTVKVEEVLKDDKVEPIATGDSVVTDRQGGRVKFPSGRVESQRIVGQSPPQVGGRYILFLGFNPYEAGTRKLTGPRGNMRRNILTGYELRDGKVFALDMAGEFQDHTGKEAMAFLAEIRRLITDSSQTPR